jgi:hypothetical protein
VVPVGRRHVEPASGSTVGHVALSRLPESTPPSPSVDVSTDATSHAADATTSAVAIDAIAPVKLRLGSIRARIEL